MTLAAVADVMTERQREKIVIDPCACPGAAVHGMALQAIGGESALDVVGISGRIVIFLMTIDAFNTQRVEAEQGCGEVAVVAVSRIMRTCQRKAGQPVDLRYVIHDPGFGSMASAALGAYRLVVHIRMAIRAGGLRFGEYQRGMTGPAFGKHMLS